MSQQRFKVSMLLALVVIFSGCEQKDDSKPDNQVDPGSFQAIIDDYNKLPSCDRKIYWGESWDGKTGYIQKGSGCTPKNMNEFREYTKASADLQNRIAVALDKKTMPADQLETLEIVDGLLRGFPNYQADDITAGIFKVAELLSQTNSPVPNVVSSLANPYAPEAVQFRLEEFDGPEMKALLKALPSTIEKGYWYGMNYKELEVAPGLKFGQIVDLNYNFEHVAKPLKVNLAAAYPNKKIETGMYGCGNKNHCNSFYPSMLNLEKFLLSDEVRSLDFDEISLMVWSPEKSKESFSIHMSGKSLSIILESNFYIPYEVEQMKKELAKMKIQ